MHVPVGKFALTVGCQCAPEDWMGMKIVLKAFCCFAWNEVYFSPRKEKPEQHLDPWCVDLHKRLELEILITFFLNAVLNNAFHENYCVTGKVGQWGQSKACCTFSPY